MRVWRVGEKCRVTCEGRAVDAKVVLASLNGVSIIVEFDAIVAGYAGVMPLLWSEEDGAFKTIVGDGLRVVLAEPVSA